MLSLFDEIRRAIRASELTQSRIAHDAGLSQTHLSQFMAGSKRLSVEAVERLAESLELEIVIRKRRGRRSTRRG